MSNASLRVGRRWLASLAVLLVSLFAVLAGAAPAQAAARTVTTIIRVPVDMSLFVPCANGGAGEVVTFTGTIFSVTHVTFDDAGGFHVDSHESEQGVAGVGATTGDRYQSIFVNLFNYNQASDSLPLTSSQELVYHVIGQGPGNDALIRITNHTTINANGTVTVAFDRLTVECQPTDPPS